MVLSDGTDLYVDQAGASSPTGLGWSSLDGPLEVTVRLRHSKVETPAVICPEGDGVLIRTRTPARAPTPGQLAVFYDGAAVVGSGWIV